MAGTDKVPARSRLDLHLTVAGLFWLLAYAVLTVNAKLDLTSSGLWISEARIIATAAGTALLLGMLMLWDRMGGLSLMLRIRMAALAIGASCVIMYAVRIVVAREFGNYGDTELADGGRWVIAWAGYFLATVSTTIAWIAIREGDVLRAHLASAAPSSREPAADYEWYDNPFDTVNH